MQQSNRNVKDELHPRKKKRYYLTAVCFLLAFNVSIATEQWKQVKGQGYVICDAIHKRLNSYQWTQEQTYEYAWSVVASFPGWKEPPWQELDVQENKNLILELIKYQLVGADVYYGKKPAPPAYRDEAELRRVSEAIFDRGVRLRVWKAHLVNWLDDKYFPAGDQEIVELRYSREGEEVSRLRLQHPDKPVIDWIGITFVLTEDLKSIDRRVSDWDRSHLGTILMFGGKPHFIGSGQGAGSTMEIWREFGSHPTNFCVIEYSISNN